MPETACDGLLTIHRWTLAAQAGDIPDLAADVGRAYVSNQALLGTPAARVAPRVPTRSEVRSGDFGELVAMGIYSSRMGRTVPYSKLQTAKPYGDATVQGPDVACLTIDQGEEPAPVIVEVKLRSDPRPSRVLRPIENSLKVASEDYLVSAWAAGADMMLSHPDYRRHFALSAAQHLGRLIDPTAPLPPHAQHAVALVAEDQITAAAATRLWGDAPPISELHLVVIPDLEGDRDRIFDAASQLTYADLTSGAGPLVGSSAIAGVSGLISRDVPERLVNTTEALPLRDVVESSLWYLADEDGVAKARADATARHVDPDVRGLAELLAGRLGGATQTLRGRALENFADTARAVVDLRVPPERLPESLRGMTADDALVHAAQHVAAALLHRLERHPYKMTVTAGATGPAVQHVVGTLRRVGRHAFWPSQAAAVRGGLFDPLQRSLAIKMPTSAGKTTLMQLVVADTLDRHPDGVVAVLAPTRALVGQLYRDLRGGLPADVVMRSSQGGLDYDTDLPSAAAVLEGPGVAVVTPERFDLDWRRATTDDSGVDLDDIRLLVVDEAQHINNGPRGATLELIIAKALRRGIRVVLLASQFHDVAAIANWVNGVPLESNWRPAWLERHVYTRGLPGSRPTAARTGYLWPEGGEPQEVFALRPSVTSKLPGHVRERKHEAAALVEKWSEEGLVVVFTENKSYAQDILDTLSRTTVRLGPPVKHLAEIADSIEPMHPAEATALRNGLGLHHADVPRAVRQAIEYAARRDNGLLQCIVCTPTLLEGVDFPTRTVIAAYPPWTPTNRRPDIARLRNLEGRAGRAGKFVSGRLVVMTKDHEKAREWRRAMRQSLPPTATALTAALREMQTRAPQNMSDANGAIINAITIEALAESATVAGDLRQALETTLQRTFWSATSPPQVQAPTVNNGVNYAARVALRVPDEALRNAIYRSGLKLDGCLVLRDHIEPHVQDIVNALQAPQPDPADLDSLLHSFIRACVASLDELEDLREVDPKALRAALTAWMEGLSEEDLDSAHPVAWKALKPNHLETLIVWSLTGAFEILAALAQDLQLRELAHIRIAPSRLRYGVPEPELGDLVRNGRDRVQVARVAKEYLQEPAKPGFILLSLSDVVEQRLDAEAQAAQAAQV